MGVSRIVDFFDGSELLLPEAFSPSPQELTHTVSLQLRYWDGEWCGRLFDSDAITLDSPAPSFEANPYLPIHGRCFLSRF